MGTFAKITLYKMKQFYTLVILMASYVGFAQTTDLYFSKYAEGSSNNKFLEIYNGTGATVNLDNYAFPNVSNAPTTPGEYEFWNTFPAGATIADGDVFVIAHGSADATILAQADMTFNFLSNGDDGFALVANDGTFVDADADGEVDAGEMTGYTVLDWLGDFNGDPGSGWEVSGVANATQNGTLTRKTSVCGPNNDWDASRGYDAATMTTTAAASEWIVTGIDTGWNELGSYTGCTTTPVLTITAPGNNASLAAGTTSADVTFSVQNAPTGATYDIDVDGTVTTGISSPYAVTVQNGGSYTVTVTMMDGATAVTSDTVTFSVAFPCDLQVGTITETCQTSTSGVDLYDVTIDFTQGGTSTYTIDTAGNGTVGGDDPSTVAAGTITITGVTEGTNFTVTFTGDPSNSSCSFTRSITSPACVGTVTCVNAGDLIITEIMQNPSAVSDSDGEYFEIYNTTSAAINMAGYIIKDENSTTETHTISNLTVPANGYVVLGNNADTATNGNVPVDYEYSGIFLGNGTDGLIIECTGTVIDQVIWDNGATFPDPNGISMELATDAYDATSNDVGTNWGEATATITGSTDLGTPGAVNNFTLSNDTVELNNLSIYPNPVMDGMLYVKSNTGAPLQVIIYSALGQEMIRANEVTNSLNVASLNSGLYIVKLSQGDASTTRKLIVR
jgi:hypothetical protein